MTATESIRIVLPWKFKLREYQKKFYSAANRKYKKLYWLVHRRAGKDKTTWNFVIKESQKTVGLYVYVFPTWAQCKRNLWDAIDSEGIPFMDHIPPELIESKNESELQIKFKNGSIIQLASAEKYNRLRGMNAKGFVLSEFAFMHPKVLKTIRPILEENGGFLVIVTTPNPEAGKNHAYTLWESVKGLKEEWFTECLTIRDTKRDDGTPVISEDRILQIQADENLSDEEIATEYYCSWEGGVVGAYYEKFLRQAELEGRIGAYPWNPKFPVFTSWDLGVNDSTAIWFYQLIGSGIYIFDHYENVGEGVEHYIKYINDKPYTYTTHFMPHDFKNRVWANGAKSGYDTAKDLQGGKDNFKIIPATKVNKGIQEVRSILPRCYFNRIPCEDGLSALREYHSKYDVKNESISIKPVHDWASNSADSFRILAMSVPSKKKILTDEDQEDANDIRSKYFRSNTAKIHRWAKNNSFGWMGR